MNDLIVEIEKFCSAHGIKETTFGTRAVNDGKFVKRLRNGGRCWPETVQAARDYMKSVDAPRSTTWPDACGFVYVENTPCFVNGVPKTININGFEYDLTPKSKD